MFVCTYTRVFEIKRDGVRLFRENRSTEKLRMKMRKKRGMCSLSAANVTSLLHTPPCYNAYSHAFQLICFY
jgi:hypothetical protein